MSFTSGSTLLDTVVLAVVSREGTYGYKITQDVRNVIDISESTLYPVLRRLQKEGMLETYDVEVDGRNRRYYKITSIGMIKLDEERSNWKKYVEQINFVLFGNKKI
ncbi:MAG: helix-turn-helix transcriptional regulator [Spirochaetaceae bacterium]|nr:helix-turn-helix transcriptional regulator [Spirochaetaceae bacterium]MBP3449205.1 helix-turn-helix transcriptional regulator [Spirochaetaceae bacterium]MBQ7905515.1 helix-turn-helix transcriptional regulator [Spirochaetaceae bacterium]